MYTNTGRLLERRGRWPRDVAVWLIDVFANTNDLACMEKRLTEAERQRAHRYRLQADRARFVCTRYALRNTLATCTGCEPEELRFDEGPHGKPFLAAAPGVSFSVSHSGRHGLVAISERRSVGVDVEWIDAGFDWRSIADLVCSAQERRVIENVSPERHGLHFYRVWTAKEALVKAVGLGIGNDLASITVHASAGELEPATVSAGSEFAAVTGLHYSWIDEVEGHQACIAFGADQTSDTTPRRSGHRP